MNQFTKENLSQVRRDLEIAMAEVCKKHGIKPATIHRISFTQETFTIQKMTFGLEASQPKLSGVDPNSLIGQRYKQGQRTFTVTRGNADGSVTARTNRGAMYNIRIDQLERMIKL
jgi:hypothetical protein